VTVYIQLTGGKGRRTELTRPTPPYRGTSEELAEALRGYARVGVSHVQLVLDPITTASIAECAPVLELLDRG
jgi:hypothetical protein